MIADYWHMLPDSNMAHLRFLLKHFLKLCSDSDANTLEEISKIFSFLIVRPPDNEAGKFITNLDIHEKVGGLI